VAEIPGHEAVVQMKSDATNTLVFLWEYPGEEDSGKRPSMRIEGECPVGGGDAALAFWDAILDSVRPLW
jgi:hypothetical protein